MSEEEKKDLPENQDESGESKEPEADAQQSAGQEGEVSPSEGADEVATSSETMDSVETDSVIGDTGPDKTEESSVAETGEPDQGETEATTVEAEGADTSSEEIPEEDSSDLSASSTPVDEHDSIPAPEAPEVGQTAQTSDVSNLESAQEEKAAESTEEEPVSEPSAEMAGGEEEKAAESTEEEPVSEPSAEMAGGEEEKAAESTEEEPVSEPSAEMAGGEEEDDGTKWYVVHTYSGYEQKAKLALEERIKQSKLDKLFSDILIPSENVIELVRGQKKTTSRKFFPGYMLVKMVLNEITWHLVKNTPRITGFVGNAVNPPAVPPEEVTRITSQMQQGTLKPRPKVEFEEGENVRVIDGPFVNFNGVVEEVKPDKGKLRVMVSIFGRSTPVELDFVQVEKN